VTRHRYTVAGWGIGELWLGDGVVLAHELTPLGAGGNQSPLPTGDDRGRGAAANQSPLGGTNAPTRTIAEKVSPMGDGFVADLTRRVHRQLEGRKTTFADVPLDLSWCTPFQAALAQTLRGVPWGEIVTYGELAAHAGRPGAARAAGAFCARNRFWLLLPCHRVVAAAGIGGYGDAGVDFKRRLLALEHVTV
jgi:methylated-DNA-[protein]-cysteine S-methyltransferase